jgi:phosphoglycerate dehydrogenase-like enzyme
MRIAILDDYQNVALDMADWSAVKAKAEVTVFNDHLDALDDQAERLQPFDVIVAMRERTPFPVALFDRLPNLKLLVTSGMVNRGIDLEAANAHKVIVCGAQSTGASTAELAWGLILSVARNIPGEDRATRDGQWQTGVGVALQGRTLGVIGLGKLGSQVAKVGLAMGMQVFAWSQNLTAERCAEIGVTFVSKEVLLSTADVISIHVVLSERTRGLLGCAELALMKPTAFLINTSRGPIIDEAALIEALQKGTIGGAGLDVFDVEPLPLDHPLRTAPRTVLSPHMGYVTDQSYALWFEQDAEDVAVWLAGKPPLRALNPDVLT